MSLENLSEGEIRELALLAKELHDNPSTRSEALRLTKKIRQDLPIPELDLQDRVEKNREAMQAKIDSLEAKLRENDARKTLDERRRALKDNGKVSSDDEIKEVEKIMVEKKIADHETAADYFNWMKQAEVDKPTPIFQGSPVLNNFDLKNYFKNPQNAARENAMQALTELRSPKRPIGL
ncbi:MAG: hypothetical protein EB117_14710 [Betaproteobacteria bacterium]|nr:hypothetical protein [Betaproteobacteria bacterium]